MHRRPGFPARLDMPPAPGAPRAPAPARPPLPAGAPAAGPVPHGLGLDSAAVRARMVQRLAAGGITSPAVLQAMGMVERHRFVDTALVNQAYEDTSLPIGLGQTISKPSIVARMTELLLGAEGARSGGLGRVLEIGTGCGYQAAVLARVAREVYTIERLRALHEKARDNLRPWRLTNAHLILGDGMAGYAKGAPYAAIIAAAGGETIPDAWVQQLAVGGRLVAPMAAAGGRQVLVVIDRTPHGLQQSTLEAVHFVPLKSGIA
ncbi:protein-L-isoaspartate(D-aspartate) O-methyltransferase [Paracidovorax avenae]|uniref:protein-L-isoaspartate(D-aspartate) O-methyltransferase n=1 Tax=Paracidovorax avenae TaxID=80867 RepID=UPI000D20AA72|nr:protein-L-isoaspartate(D-aspartate) O-methyltransferase [Paracidovorax avenae]AVT12357.1 protein-L-isoaspartate O-methyltransferase [Paracidovorax avenae]